MLLWVWMQMVRLLLRLGVLLRMLLCGWMRVMPSSLLIWVLVVMLLCQVLFCLLLFREPNDTIERALHVGRANLR
jgi:hypothetical protein